MSHTNPEHVYPTNTMGIDQGLLGTVLAAGSILVLVVILAATAWYNEHLDIEIKTKSLDVQNEALAELRSAQADKIAKYRWVDASKETVTLPISRAMELIVAEAKKPSVPGAVTTAVQSVVPAVQEAVKNVSQDHGH